ncbi:hypothetical protein [Delftia sp. PS-11]|uniref:hypothetical protein n=1 Tax=Delftia sp. PS-11 TaxID=2767222 RepID=UPI003AB79BA1
MPYAGTASQGIPVALLLVVLHEPFGQPVHATQLYFRHVRTQPALQPQAGKTDEEHQQSHQQQGQGEECLVLQLQARHGERRGLRLAVGLRRLLFGGQPPRRP